MLERKHVAVSRDGVVRIKKTGEEIGRVERVGPHRMAWKSTGHPLPVSYREEAVEDVIRAYNEREGA